MSISDHHYTYDLEYSHIVREIKIPISIYASPDSTEGRCIKLDALWDTGATISVITPGIAKELRLSSVDKCMISGVNVKDKLSDVVMLTIALPNGMIMYGKRFSICEIPGADVLIGMDIISMGDFVITNAKGKTMFSFVIPTLNNKISFSDLASDISDD